MHLATNQDKAGTLPVEGGRDSPADTPTGTGDQACGLTPVHHCSPYCHRITLPAAGRDR